MEKLYLQDIDELGDYMFEAALDGRMAYAALFYEEATALLRSLLDFEEVEISNLDIAEEDINGYDKEYYVALDTEFNVNVEKAWLDKNDYHEAGYKYFEADCLYLDGAVSYGIVKQQGNVACDTYELEFEDYCNSCDECDLCAEYDNKEKEQIKAFQEVIDFLSYLFGDDDNSNTVVEDNSIEEFIHRRFGKDANWLVENCYYFAVILKDRFPGGAIYYDVINGHFVYKYLGRYYDHTGVVDADGYYVKWDTFENYDSIQKQRIIRDCIK